MALMSKEYKQRFISSCLSIILLITLFILAPYALFQPFFAAAVAVIASIGIIEFSRLLRAKQIIINHKFLIVWTFAYCFLLLLTAHFPFLRGYLLLGIPLSFIALFFTHFENPRGSLDQVAYSILILVYLSFPMGLLVDIVYGLPLPAGSVTGLFWLIYLLVVTKSTDMAALFIGRAFGKKKLCPKISPNKTVVGALAGMGGAALTSLIIALGAPLVLHKLFILPWQALLLGLVIGIVAEIGDLLESLFKRDAKIDDSSNILPGLGGVLDILDSLLLTTPVVWAAMRMLS